MIKFIKVTDAINNKKMLIRTDMITTVEESTHSTFGKDCVVCKITFNDNRPEEYVTQKFSYFEDFLCNS